MRRNINELMSNAEITSMKTQLKQLKVPNNEQIPWGPNTRATGHGPSKVNYPPVVKKTHTPTQTS